MRIEGENGWLELSPRDDEEAFDIRCSVGDFSGRNPGVWIDANEQRRFLEELRRLERDRRGEARVASMSPNEFALVVRVVDRLGHVGVEGLIGRLRYSEHRGDDRLLLRFGLTLDPSRLLQLVRDVEDLAAAGQ